jgi:hypothetical protein
VVANVGPVVARLTRFVTRGWRARSDGEPKLPIGAEAALWSILEAVPHPRNHLALTRDLSGEVRLTDRDRAEINAAFDAYVAEEVIVDVREPPATVDSYYDLGVINENRPLTDNLFSSAER